MAAAREVVRERLGEALRVVPVEQARTWVGLAGTMTTVSALAHDMTTYDSAAIHLSRVGVDRLLTVCDGLIGMTRAQRAALGPMHEGRVDVIGGGAIVIEELALRAARARRHRRADGQRARHPGRHCAVDRRLTVLPERDVDEIEQCFFCSVYSCSLSRPSARSLAISRIAAATPVMTVRGAGVASVSSSAGRFRGRDRSAVAGLLSCADRRRRPAGRPSLARPFRQFPSG